MYNFLELLLLVETIDIDFLNKVKGKIEILFINFKKWTSF